MESDGYDSRVDQDVAKHSQALSKAVGAPNKSFQPQKSKSSLHVMPAFDDILKGKAAQAHPPVAGTGEKEFISQMVEKISNPQRQDRSGEIPSLDLGQQILAQQRKIAALKRKSPGPLGDALRQQEIKPQPPQIKSPLGDGLRQMPQAPPSPHQLIITDIVAKEIMALSSAR